MLIDLADGLDLSIEDIVSRRTVVLGASGSGKSNTVARLVEQCGKSLPFVIADWHGEYYGLRVEGAGFDHVLIAGCSEHADIDLKPDQAAALAECVYSGGMSVILDLLLYDAEQRIDLIARFFASFWQQAIRHKKPYLCVLDEAHNYMPEGFVRSEARARMKQFALEGRKFGLGMVIATQTISELSKTVLKQCELKLLHRVHMADDAKTYQRLIPGFTQNKINEMVLQLRRPGHIIAVKDAEPTLCQVKKRDTYHPSVTPGIENGIAPVLRAIDTALIEEMRKALTPEYVGAHASDAPEALLRQQLVEALAEIERLKALLSLAQYAPAQTAEGVVLPADTILEAVAQRADDRESRSDLIIENRQRGAFVRNISRLQKLPRLTKDVGLLFLKADFPPSSTAALASKLKVRMDSIRPGALVDAGLLRRVANGRGYVYESSVEEYMAAHTHLSREFMLEAIRKALS
jgi:hypothetical protein